ncbi:hypothetical protein [Actinomadura sp. 7K507]|uniref:hypothetical protein n=1 Tax=Actinomadura sp. 7K507 TaxID=2530365 RepID=UPI001A9DA272|nr:hypothetical protein [Actinomadura sp. 7K507]
MAYSASKAAFGRLAGAISAEYLGRGVRAFNLDPGFVVTEAGAARGGLASLQDEGYEPKIVRGPAATSAVTRPDRDGRG